MLHCIYIYIKYSLRPSDKYFLWVFICETGVALGPTGTGTPKQVFVISVLLIVVCLRAVIVVGFGYRTHRIFAIGLVQDISLSEVVLGRLLG